MAAQNKFVGPLGVEIVGLLSGLLGHQPHTMAKMVNDTAQQALRYSNRNDGTGIIAPAPTRFVDMGRAALIKSVLGTSYPAYADALKSDAPPTESLLAASANNQINKEVARLLIYSDSTAEQGVALSACGFGTSNLAESRFLLCGGVILDVAPELHHLLEQTDVGDDLPWSQLRLPYPAIYVHLPPPEPGSGPQISGDTTGRHDEHHDGFYAFEDVTDDGRRMITMMLVRNGAEGSATGSTTMMGALIEDEDQSIQERIEQLIRNYDGKHNADKRSTELQVATAQAVFSYLTKVMLYMSLPDRATLFASDRTEALQKAATVPAGLMRKKYQQKAERLYDHIIVGLGVATHAETQANHAVGSRAAHWRRGHFRGQRVGAGRVNIKTVWVRPALVGIAHGLDTPARKSYSLET